MGKVTLKDYPEGPAWLTWWEANRGWVGSPLWVDRGFQEHPSCAGFEVQIICLNSDPAVRGSAWEMGPTLLGTQAMLRSGLQPYPDAQPAEIVQNFLIGLSNKGVDTWYLAGKVQSAPIPSGEGTIVQYYQLVRFEWPANASSSDTAKVQLTVLGKTATEQHWG
jgi:hypothetical protein